MEPQKNILYYFLCTSQGEVIAWYLPLEQTFVSIQITATVPATK